MKKLKKVGVLFFLTTLLYVFPLQAMSLSSNLEGTNQKQEESHRELNTKADNSKISREERVRLLQCFQGELLTFTRNLKTWSRLEDSEEFLENFSDSVNLSVSSEERFRAWNLGLQNLFQQDSSDQIVRKKLLLFYRVAPPESKQSLFLRQLTDILDDPPNDFSYFDYELLLSYARYFSFRFADEVQENLHQKAVQISPRAEKFRSWAFQLLSFTKPSYDIQPYLVLGKIYWEYSKFSEAFDLRDLKSSIQAYEKVTSATSENTLEALWMLSQIETHSRKKEDYLFLAAKAGHPLAFLELSRLSREQKNMHSSESFLQKAIKQGIERPQYVIFPGIVHDFKGQEMGSLK